MLGVVVVSVATVALWRSAALAPRTPSEEADDLARKAIARGQAEYRSISMIQTNAWESPSAVTERLRQGTVSAAPPSLPAEAVQDLLDQAGEFLYWRYAQDSVARYRAWRRERGYVRIGADSLRADGIPRRYEMWTGGAYPGDDSLDDVFDRLWDVSMRYRGEANRVVAMATEGRGIAVSFGTLTTGNPGAWPAIRGQMPIDWWHGRTAGGHECWWTSPAGDALACLRAHGALTVACLGVVVEFARGDRYPLRLMFFMDPKADRWWLEAVQVLNASEDRFPLLDF